MLKRFWLFLAQATTVLLTVVFIIATLKPQWLPSPGHFGWRLAEPIIALQHTRPTFGSRTAERSYADAAQKAMPAVVNVFSSKEGKQLRAPRLNNQFFQYFFGEGGKQPLDQSAANLGSGVIVDARGYILTDEHVVGGADDIEVVLADGRKASAKLIGTDPETDLAVLKIDLKDLPTITFSRFEKARVGDVALAIGNPFGVGQTVTIGIISALGRDNLGINAFENFIQTDASINPGNSGGALVDADGNLLGINTAIYSRTGGSLGIGFAVPVPTLRTVLESIIATGTVTRGWIGVEPQNITPEIAESFALTQKSGALIAGVLQGGPADKAGIRPGDIIISVNDQAITNRNQLLEMIARIQPGSSVKLALARKNKHLDLTLTVVKRPPPPKEEEDEGEKEETDSEEEDVPENS